MTMIVLWPPLAGSATRDIRAQQDFEEFKFGDDDREQQPDRASGKKASRISVRVMPV